MRKFRENPAMKALAFIAAVAAFAAAAVMGWYQLANYDALWDPDYNAADGYSIYYLEQTDLSRIEDLLNLYQMQQAGVDLSVYQEREISRLESSLSAEHTNLRWQLLSEDKTVLRGNTESTIPAQAMGLYWTYYQSWEQPYSVYISTDAVWGRTAAGSLNVTDPSNAVYTDDWSILLEELYLSAIGQGSGTDFSSTEASADEDTVFLSADGTSSLLVVDTAEGAYLFGPSLRACLEANQFGYQYLPLEGGWSRVSQTEGDYLELVLWLDNALPIDDEYRQAYNSLTQWKGDRELLLGGTVACALLGLILTIFLCAAAGHRRGREDISLSWFHRIPGDLLLVLLGCAMAVICAMASAVITGYYTYTDLSMAWQLILLGGLAAAMAAMGLGALLTVAVRCKARTIFRNTVIWRLCALVRRLALAVTEALPLTWKVVLATVAYLIFTIFTFVYMAGLWLLVTGVLAVLLWVWAFQWAKIRQGTRDILAGHTDSHIDTAHMLPDLKSHADELNNLSQAISVAVEERMRSEHFKTELITNVSHDLKTPLTSIINYVDLLKKEDISSETAQQYIEVLDRKSQRLKKLTEDLVEASKASTGALTVQLERLNFNQLLEQAMGEYQDRFLSLDLHPMLLLPTPPAYILADGRHLWRVIDNLLSNCCKYTMPGTRVYGEITREEGRAVLSVKNISREPLNISAEALMERFVRGDTSRTTEGSGLGLSIARSLTELQGGQFQLVVDGDLFKALVSFPLCGEPAPEPQPLLSPPPV